MQPASNLCQLGLLGHTEFDQGMQPSRPASENDSSISRSYQDLVRPRPSEQPTVHTVDLSDHRRDGILPFN